MPAPVIHLASESPRRREILAALGIRFTFAGVRIDESAMPGERPEEMVLRLAKAKAEAARDGTTCPVLGADTAVVLGERVFGKPWDRADGLDMLASLSGRTHRVLTGVALLSEAGPATALSATDVRFRDIGTAEAIAYWESGEPWDKAGAYAIQGAGGVFVEEIRGSYSGVVGLPVFETARLLQAAGLPILEGMTASQTREHQP
jgi:nucleoside triphosphate pyrophosphatase